VYLHIGRAGEEAPAVADLAEGVKAGPVSGVVAQGTLGPAALRETTLRQLLQALRKNEVYVTVHTLAHPGGELRGQLRLQPIVASRKQGARRAGRAAAVPECALGGGRRVAPRAGFRRRGAVPGVELGRWQAQREARDEGGSERVDDQPAGHGAGNGEP